MTFEQNNLISQFNDRIRGNSSEGGASSLLFHPLMLGLKGNGFDKEQIQNFCRLRYGAASDFEALVERALELAKADPSKTEIAQTLHHNLCDERGVDYTTGVPREGADHQTWRTNFLNAIGVEPAPSQNKENALYQFKESDSLATLLGMILAAEMTIPSENARSLAALRRVYPHTFTKRYAPDEGTPEQIKNTHYLQEHLRQDSGVHAPALAAAITKHMTTSLEKSDVLRGLHLFIVERKNLYNHIQEQLGGEELPIAAVAGGWQR